MWLSLNPTLNGWNMLKMLIFNTIGYNHFQNKFFYRLTEEEKNQTERKLFSFFKKNAKRCESKRFKLIYTVLK